MDDRGGSWERYPPEFSVLESGISFAHFGVFISVNYLVLILHMGLIYVSAQLLRINDNASKYHWQAWFASRSVENRLKIINNFSINI